MSGVVLIENEVAIVIFLIQAWPMWELGLLSELKLLVTAIGRVNVIVRVKVIGELTLL